MKKISLLLIAAATFAFTSCGGNKEGATQDPAQEAAAQEAVKDGVNFEGEHYTLTYPKGWQETSAFGDVLNVQSEDGEMKFIANFDDGGPTIAQLGEYATNLKAFHQNGKMEEPVINDKVLTVKAVDEGNVEIHFAIMKEDKVGLIGSIKAPEAKAADAETALKGIMGSVAFK